MDVTYTTMLNTLENPQDVLSISNVDGWFVWQSRNYSTR